MPQAKRTAIDRTIQEGPAAECTRKQRTPFTDRGMQLAEAMSWRGV